MTGETRRMLYGIQHPHLWKSQDELLARRVRPLRRKQLVAMGRAFSISLHPRIYVNGRTPPAPFFPDCNAPSTAHPGAVPKNRGIAPARSDRNALMPNKEVDWQQLGFVCDGVSCSPAQPADLPAARQILRFLRLERKRTPHDLYPNARRRLAEEHSCSTFGPRS